DQRDAIALLDAKGGERRGERVALAMQLPVRHLGALEEERRLRRMVARERRQVIEKGLVRVRLKRVRNVRVVLRQPGLGHGAILVGSGQAPTKEASAGAPCGCAGGSLPGRERLRPASRAHPRSLLLRDAPEGSA